MPSADTPPTLQSPQAPAAANARPPPPLPSGEPASAAPADPTSSRSDGRSPRILIALAAVVAIAVAAALLGRRWDDDGSSSERAAVAAATDLPADLEWQPTANLPYKRQYAASTAVNGEVWLFGGIRTNRSSTTTKVYDPASNRWSTGAGLPKALHHFAAVTYKGEAVVIGGFVPDTELTSQQSDAVYVLRDGIWQQMASLNHKRAAAAAAVVDDKIVVVGGQADGELVPQTEVFDGERWTDSAEIPTPREHLGAASDGRYLYAVGGHDIPAEANSAAFERYDPKGDSWTELEDMPEPVSGVGAGYAGGRIVAVGGEAAPGVSGEVYGYDVGGRQWSDLPALPTPRHGVAVTQVDNVLYATGGATEPGHFGPTDDVEVLDLSGKSAAPVDVSLEWHQAGQAPSKIQYAATAEVDQRVWLFGGIGENEKATADSLAYDRVIDRWTPGPPMPQPVTTPPP